MTDQVLSIRLGKNGYEAEISVDGVPIKSVAAIHIDCKVSDMTTANLLVYPTEIEAALSLDNVTVHCPICQHEHRCGHSKTGDSGRYLGVCDCGQYDQGSDI
jgi:hypothetical protein